MRRFPISSATILAVILLAPSARAEPPYTPPRPADIFRAIAAREAEARGLPPAIADAVMKIESAYRPAARGAAGEIGLMQVMPPTAQLMGFLGDGAALADPETNIKLGVRYLAEAWKLASGDLCTALMKYRAGHNETRFSVLSVRYCVAARTHLASIGYPVTGEVPEPTFGFRQDNFRMGVAIGTQQAARRLSRGVKLASRVSWRSYDRRMKSLDQRLRAFSL
ncbi:MAG: transglycosylase SLT domain-containing protein [Beijerinckiaceae bacterium]